MALHQRNTGELLSPVVVVTVLARQIELADPRRIELAAGVDEWLRLLVVYDCDRKSARLLAHVSREREQLAALMRERFGLLLLGTAEIDALLDVDRAVLRRREGRIARRDAAHRGGRIAVAVSAGFPRLARLAAPERLAIEHREGRRIRRIIILHGARRGAHAVVAGAALV